MYVSYLYAATCADGGQHAGLARLALLYVVGLLLRLLLLVLVRLYHIGFNAARSCSCEGEGPERRTRNQYIIRYISLCTDVQCVIDKTGSIATIRVLVQCIVSNYIKLGMGLLCPCRNCREALHRELDKLWPPSVRRRASGQKEESRALEIPGKTTAWFPKKNVACVVGKCGISF